jgi:hypothetical protein
MEWSGCGASIVGADVLECMASGGEPFDRFAVRRRGAQMALIDNVRRVEGVAPECTAAEPLAAWREWSMVHRGRRAEEVPRP